MTMLQSQYAYKLRFPGGEQVMWFWYDFQSQQFHPVPLGATANVCINAETVFHHDEFTLCETQPIHDLIVEMAGGVQSNEGERA